MAKTSLGEELLYQIARHLYKKFEIRRNSRPPWLSGLELDLYIPVLKLAFEFDGPQHRFPTEGMQKNEEHHRYQKRNDRWKDERCRKNGVLLVRVSARTLKPIRVRKLLGRRLGNSKIGAHKKATAKMNRKRFPSRLETKCAAYRKEHAYTPEERQWRREHNRSA